MQKKSTTKNLLNILFGRQFVAQSLISDSIYLLMNKKRKQKRKRICLKLKLKIYFD